MKLLEKARETDEYLGKHVVQPFLALLITIAAIAWCTYWLKPLFYYSGKDYADPERWYDIMAFVSFSAAAIFVALIAIRKWALVLINNKHKTNIQSILSNAIKFFAVPFGISILYLAHGIYVVFNTWF